MTEAEYIAALAEVWLLMNAAPGSDEERRLVETAEKVAEYEMMHYPMEG